MTELARPKAVLWDFDGTLVDSEPMWTEHEQDIMARHGVTMPEQWYLDHCGQPAIRTSRLMSEALGGAMSTAEVHEELHQRICDRFAAGEIPWLPGARELLADLVAHGVRCAMVTASVKRIMTVVAQALPEFEFIIDGDDVSRTKPDPEGYLLAMERLGVAPHEVLILEDSVPGTAAGLAAGAAVLAVPTLIPVEPAPRRVIRPEGLVGLGWDELSEIWRSQW
ncbi:MAG: HAD family phosphatase [Arachnia propionica]|nr:HAD family phosphatase [Arachnia propionica]